MGIIAEGLEIFVRELMNYNDHKAVIKIQKYDDLGDYNPPFMIISCS